MGSRQGPAARAGPAAARTPCSRTRATTATRGATNWPGAASSRSSPPAAPRESRGWASCAMSSSRPSPYFTSSNALPSDGNATWTCTRPWSPSPAPSSADAGSRTNDQDRVRSSYGLVKAAKDVTSVVTSLIVLLAVSVAVFVLWRAWQASRRPQLVLRDLINASGLPELDPTTPGLSELTRQSLLMQLRDAE